MTKYLSLSFKLYFMINDLTDFWVFFPIILLISIYFFVIIFCLGRYRKAYTPEIREIMKLSRQDPNYLQSHPEAQEKMKEFSKRFMGEKFYARITEKMQNKGIDPFNPKQNISIKPSNENYFQNQIEPVKESIEKYPDSNNQINKNEIAKTRNFAIVDGNTNPKYFICPFCGADVKIGKDKCPKCKNAV